MVERDMVERDISSVTWWSAGLNVERDIVERDVVERNIAPHGSSAKPTSARLRRETRCF